MNQPIEEKCEYCKAWESETGFGKECKHDDPIEEKWSKEFFEKFGANKIWVVPSKENVETILDIWSFIENLLEQERQRMSEEVKESCSCSSHVDGCSGKTYIDTVISIINK